VSYFEHSRKRRLVKREHKEDLTYKKSFDIRVLELTEHLRMMTLELGEVVRSPEEIEREAKARADEIEVTTRKLQDKERAVEERLRRQAEERKELEKIRKAVEAINAKLKASEDAVAEAEKELDKHINHTCVCCPPFRRLPLPKPVPNLPKPVPRA
jgi:septal ring factor EnvC (AmiA/AmiB activator)